MPELNNTIIHKTEELVEELKASGLWQKEMPVWVHAFEDGTANSATNFAQWLQFVFVPNHLHRNKTQSITGKNLMVPHAIKYFGDDVKKGKLLRILIEIDSLL